MSINLAMYILLLFSIPTVQLILNLLAYYWLRHKHDLSVVCVIDLHLKDNLLSALPDSICKMMWLSMLDVSHNKIATFPKAWDTVRLNRSIG